MDLGFLTDIQSWYSAGVAAAFWAHLMLVCPYFSRKAGVAHEEPPYWLYGSQFNALRWVSLLLAIAAGLFMPLAKDISLYVSDRGIPLALSAVYDAILAAILLGALWFYRRRKAQSEAVVLEPLTAGGIVLRALVVLLILGGLIGGPWAANEYMQLNVLSPLFGPEGSTSIRADLGGFLGMLITFVLLWVIPELIAELLDARDVSPVWAQSSGLVFFRWAWMGLVVFASLGAFGSIPGVGAVFIHPMPNPLGIALPIIGAAIFLLLWVWPMHAMAKKALDGDVIAAERLPNVRFGGFFSYLAYTAEARKRPKGLGDGDEKKLCATCLRPVNDLSYYKDFRFDHCPHCGAFIPPVFSMLDYVRHQSAKLAPLFEEEGPPGQIKRKKQRGADETALVQELLKALITLAVHERGTDLHLIIEKDKLAVRCRTDGVLYTMIEFGQAMARPLISAAKVLASMDITERRKPQDGSFSLTIADKKIDVRINTSPVPSGEMAAMRLLYLQDVIGSIEKLGMGQRNVKTMSKLIHNPTGLILVTGPTGSGKSTTLYNALSALSTGERNIVTLEDPIEYQISGLTQMQINPNKGFTFATGLKTILRQDPDVIMVGEIRDGETARMAIDAAATGHLVFSTLHANDSIGVLGRLTDLEIDSNRLADTLVLAMAQRLIRLICSRCSREYPCTKQELADKGVPGAPQEIMMLRKGDGCPHCHETGFYGREGIYEFFAPNEELRSLITQSAGTQAIRSRARALGMRTLLEDGLVKVLLGRTTVEELHRVTS